ncbi:hypothetical protein KSP40_PGU020010 [Platanthera guangdongensis]|uniref:Uncharacterized protein n=1 Tax=Platanthera guangdongensis TaxID=2320717 RepID=A0ABR2LW86_9ASPA
MSKYVELLDLCVRIAARFHSTALTRRACTTIRRLPTTSATSSSPETPPKSPPPHTSAYRRYPVAANTPDSRYRRLRSFFQLFFDAS